MPWTYLFSFDLTKWIFPISHKYGINQEIGSIREAKNDSFYIASSAGACCLARCKQHGAHPKVSTFTKILLQYRLLFTLHSIFFFFFFKEHFFEQYLHFFTALFWYGSKIKTMKNWFTYVMFSRCVTWNMVTHNEYCTKNHILQIYVWNRTGDSS